MIIIRVIIILLLFWLVMMALGWIAKWWLLKKFGQNNAQHNIEDKPLVQCASCQTFIAKDLAVAHNDGKFYCQEHAENHKQEK